MNRTLVALGILWAAVTGGMVALPGCYGHNCDASTGVYGTKPGEGRMIDENTWESSPMDGKWLHFSSQHIWYFEVPALGDRTPFRIETYISPVEDPNHTFSNFTMAGGNLGELSGVGPNRFVVRNGTCAEYFVRVVVEVPPKPTEIAPGTAGEVDASVEAGDAGDDAAVTADADVDSAVTDAATD
jgi:hypothetical protein